MKRSLFVLFAVFSALGPVSVRAESAPPPNVLVIIVDDLNDWIGCMAGHPQAKTPNIDRLAKRGTLFTNAHVQATFCGPSRVSFLSGRMPQTTGCRDFERYESLSSLKGHPPFPMHFRNEGYTTFGGGKIFHHGTGDGWTKACWSTTLGSGRNPRPAERIHWPKPVWDWGPWPAADEEMGDYRLAREASAVVAKSHDDPFFVVAGFRRPHVPLHVPKKWFDLYPLEDIVLPDVPNGDLDDVPHPEMGIEAYAAPVHEKIVQLRLWRSLVQAYLASISFVDHCVGELLNGLDGGPNRDNTLVVFFSDHGFHLGEKQHWAKRTLWEETTRVPLILCGPGIRLRTRIDKPVGLIDIYPTLCNLAGVTAPAELEGRDLSPPLANPNSDWDHPAYTTFQPGDVAVRSKDWRYIRHVDGTEELYDHRVDPKEWRNLAAMQKQLRRKRGFLNCRGDGTSSPRLVPQSVIIHENVVRWFALCKECAVPSRTMWVTVACLGVF